jgi:hypothetical protein
VLNGLQPIQSIPTIHGSNIVSLWNTTNQSLPAHRDHVQFIVGGHKAWLLGTYEGNCFRSRWATYPTFEVSFWRKPDDKPQRSGVPSRAPDQRYWSERPMRGA